MIAEKERCKKQHDALLVSGYQSQGLGLACIRAILCMH